MASDQIKGIDVNRVLTAVRACEPIDGNVQLGILAFALVVACRSMNVPQRVALARMREAFKTEFQLEPMPAPPPGLN